MPLTREFKTTIQARVQSDPAFLRALLDEAVNAFLSGEPALGKALLRDLINATMGFETLARAVDKPGKSLHRMLSPRGNPTSENLFCILRALQQHAGLRIEVKVKKAS